LNCDNVLTPKFTKIWLAFQTRIQFYYQNSANIQPNQYAVNATCSAWRNPVRIALARFRNVNTRAEQVGPQLMDQNSEPQTLSPFPGNVLVAACGFIVTGAGWGLFAYLEGDLSATSSAGVFFTMALLHILTGALIFSRMAIAVPIGLVLAILGLGIAAIQPQYVLVFTNIVIIALLVLARGNVAARQRADDLS
jgi:hypothetical protein